MPSDIRIAHSTAADSIQAVQEFHSMVAGPDVELVVFFCSSQYDLPAIAGEMNRLFAGKTVIGCTSAGEIGPAGYCNHSLSGFSLPSHDFRAVVGRLANLQGFEVAMGDAFVRTLEQKLNDLDGVSHMPQHFGFLMIDGLSVREEPVARAFQHALGNTPIVGGSAGDDMVFAKTWVFYEGAFHSDSAILAIVATHYPIKAFKTQHFKSEEERLVVTEANVATRTVMEINGCPAAEEYARLVGVDVAHLSPGDFATMPVVVVIDGTDYVRSIQKANPDGSLTFYSAIDEGLVLRVARGMDLVSNLQETFAAIQGELGVPQLVIACDCILRNLEISRNELRPAVSAVFNANQVVGFSTYGEQYMGVHVNQTLTGIVIGSSV